MLAAAAILGRQFSFGLVRDTSGRSEDETLAAIEECLARGLLVETGRPAPSPRTTSRTRSCARSSRRTRAWPAAGCSTGAPPSGWPGRRRRRAPRLAAEHFRRAGMEPEAAEWFERAGRAARSVFANREAAGHLMAAMAMGHPRQAGLHEDVGDLLTLLGDYGGALVHYEAAAAGAEAPDLPRVEHRLAALHHRRGEFALAEQHFRAALDGSPEPADRALVQADRSLNAHRAGDGELAGEPRGRRPL